MTEIVEPYVIKELKALLTAMKEVDNRKIAFGEAMQDKNNAEKAESDQKQRFIEVMKDKSSLVVKLKSGEMYIITQDKKNKISPIKIEEVKLDILEK